MSILFINGSPNKNGNTAALAAELLKDHGYETLNLTATPSAHTARTSPATDWMLSLAR